MSGLNRLVLSLCSVTALAILQAHPTVAQSTNPPPGVLPAVEPAPPRETPETESETQPSEAVPPERRAAGRTPAPGAVRVNLMEGSVFSGTLSVDALTVDTEFGTLEIPVGSIVSFTPGLDSHPQLQARIDRLIQKLGSNDAAERDGAQRDLTDFGPGIAPQLEPFRKDPDTERRTRVEKILDDLESRQFDGDFAESRQAELIAEDTVETDRFTVVGRISPQSFQIETPFGPLNVALQDIRSIARESSTKPEQRARVTVDASNLPQIGLKETGIRLERGDRVQIIATGSLVMTPWGNNVTASPDGAGMNVPFYANGIASGALIGRVGRNGEDMLIGSRNEFTAKASGTLYLGVAMAHQFANQGYTFPGSYEIRVRVNPESH